MRVRSRAIAVVVVLLTALAVVEVLASQGDDLVVEPTEDRQAGVGVFTLVLGEGLDDATVGSRITAHAAGGTKLGNEHDRTEGMDFGSWDGFRDRRDEPTVAGGTG